MKALDVIERLESWVQLSDALDDLIRQSREEVYEGLQDDPSILRKQLKDWSMTVGRVDDDINLVEGTLNSIEEASPILGEYRRIKERELSGDLPRLSEEFKRCYQKLGDSGSFTYDVDDLLKLLRLCRSMSDFIGKHLSWIRLYGIRKDIDFLGPTEAESVLPLEKSKAGRPPDRMVQKRRQLMIEFFKARGIDTPQKADREFRNNEVLRRKLYSWLDQGGIPLPSSRKGTFQGYGLWVDVQAD